MEKLRREILIEVEKSLYTLDERLKRDAKKVQKSLSKDIVLIIESIKRLQKENKIGVIDSMVFVLSRVEIDNNNFAYPVFLYGEKTYVDEYKTEFYLDVSSFYDCLKDIKEKALIISKKYIKEEISMPNIENEIYRYLKYFNMNVVTELRKIFKDEKLLELLKSLITTDSFVVIQNEIYEKPYNIFEK